VEHEEKGGERCREQREGGLNATLGLGLEKTSYLYLLFFLSAGLVEPVPFDLVQSVLDFGNETEPELFCDFYSVFSSLVFSVIFFPVFSV